MLPQIPTFPRFSRNLVEKLVVPSIESNQTLKGIHWKFDQFQSSGEAQWDDTFTMHSEILASLNMNKNYNIFPFIGEQPYIETLFWQFSSLTTYVRVLDNFLTNISMYCSSPIQGRRSKEVKKNYKTNLSPTFNKNQGLLPWIGEQGYIEMFFQQFSNIPDICG